MRTQIHKTTTFFAAFLLLQCYFIQVVNARNNPIMIINCEDEDEEEEVARRNRLNVRAAVMSFPCDAGTCKAGTVPFDNGGMDPCMCVPDCTTSTEENTANCTECANSSLPITWQDGPQACGCDDMTLGMIGCGCPPWFDIIDDGGFDGCQIKGTPCYKGALNASIDDGCDDFDGSGFVMATITIFVDAGSAVTLADLENCELTSGENFVLALAQEIADNTDAELAEPAFVDDDGDGEIVIEFMRDPALPSVIDFRDYDDDGDIRLAACAAAIPTLSTWTLIILGFLMAIVGVVIAVNGRKTVKN